MKLRSIFRGNKFNGHIQYAYHLLFSHRWGIIQKFVNGNPLF